MSWLNTTLSSVFFALCVVSYLPVANADAQSILAKKDSKGFILSDSRAEIPYERVGDAENRADYFAMLPEFLAGAIILGKSGVTKVNDKNVEFTIACKPVNDRTIAVITRAI